MCDQNLLPPGLATSCTQLPPRPPPSPPQLNPSRRRCSSLFTQPQMRLPPAVAETSLCHKEPSPLPLPRPPYLTLKSTPHRPTPLSVSSRPHLPRPATSLPHRGQSQHLAKAVPSPSPSRDLVRRDIVDNLPLRDPRRQVPPPPATSRDISSARAAGARISPLSLQPPFSSSRTSSAAVRGDFTAEEAAMTP